jgi:hypothetical protein
LRPTGEKPVGQDARSIPFDIKINKRIRIFWSSDKLMLPGSPGMEVKANFPPEIAAVWEGITSQRNFPGELPHCSSGNSAKGGIYQRLS